MQQKALLYLILASFVFQACTKKAVPLLTIEPKKINIEEIDFEYFHGKARVNFRDNKKEREVKSTIRVRKDSIISEINSCFSMEIFEINFFYVYFLRLNS